MENDREVDSVLMNVKNTTGGVMSAITFSARATMKLLSLVGRLAKKGLVAGGLFDNFQNFQNETKGDYTTYNIPLSDEKAKMVKQMQSLELELEKETGFLAKASLKRQIADIEKNIPEIQQLKKLGISHCVLPKLNGSMNTIQVAIAKKDDQSFKNWFLNHLTTNMAGGEKSLETLKVFTEGNYSVLNMPFEDAQGLGIMIADFDKMSINYSILPDLNVGDGYTQVAIANSDRNQVEHWFKLYKEKLLQNGEEAKDMYELNSESYANTAELSPDSYINTADAIYQSANQEFVANETGVPWNAKLASNNSPEFLKFSQDNNYEQVTINIDKLVDFRTQTNAIKALEDNGFFVSRLPGYTGENEKQLVIPKDKVFTTDAGKTVVAFLDKRENFQVLNIGSKAREGGTTEKLPFSVVKEIYDKVERGFYKTEAMAMSKDVTQNILTTSSPAKPPVLK